VPKFFLAITIRYGRQFPSFLAHFK
jgi:hypothetical protein